MFDENPADDRFERDQMIEEIKRLQGQLARYRRPGVVVLEETPSHIIFGPHTLVSDDAPIHQLQALIPENVCVILWGDDRGGKLSHYRLITPGDGMVTEKFDAARRMDQLGDDRPPPWRPKVGERVRLEGTVLTITDDRGSDLYCVELPNETVYVYASDLLPVEDE